MNITRALLGEHGVFYALFAYLEHGIPTVTELDLIRGQTVLLTAALVTHAGLENELLFAALEPHLGPVGPLAVMRMEHAQIEELLHRASEAGEPDQARRLLLRAVQVARSHFAKEEQVLFPLAHRVLNESRLSQLGRQWADQRGVTISTEETSRAK